MGMFDDIICKYKLPMPEDPKGYSGSERFQTKDLENCLSLFEIREDGTIWTETFKTEIVAGNPKAESIFGRIDRIEKTDVAWKQLFDVESIEIYNYDQTNGDYDYWISYKLNFEKGIVTSATLLEFEAESNSERKIRDEDFKKRLKEAAELSKTFRYKVFYKPWNRTISFIFRALHKTDQKFRAFLWKAESFLKIK